MPALASLRVMRYRPSIVSVPEFGARDKAVAKTFCLERGGPKDLEVEWTKTFSIVTVRWVGAVVGQYQKADVWTEVQCPLPQGSVLRIKLIPVSLVSPAHLSLRLLDGTPVPGSPGDPVEVGKQAGYVLFLVGGLSAFSGVVASAAGNHSPTSVGVGAASIVLGVLLWILGLFTMGGSRVALGAAIVLYALNAVASVWSGFVESGAPNLWVLFHVGNLALMGRFFMLAAQAGGKRQTGRSLPEIVFAVLLGIGCFAVVLLASMFALVFLGSHDEPDRMQRGLQSTAESSGSATPAGLWVSLGNTEAGYEVMMPNLGHRTASLLPNPVEGRAPIGIGMLLVEEGDTAYVVADVELPREYISEEATAESMLESMRDGVLERLPGSTPQREVWGEWNGYPMLEMWASVDAEGRHFPYRCRLYLVGRRQYQVSAIGAAEADTQRLYNSFSVDPPTDDFRFPRRSH